MTDGSSPPSDDETTGSDGSEPRSSEPLEDLATSLEERSSAGEDRPDAVDDLFDRESVADIDTDTLWERLEAGVDPVAALEPAPAREIREVDKASYCHRCEHFTRPPAVGCTNEGSEILEMPSLETFRVVDCPVVLADERLEREAGKRR